MRQLRGASAALHVYLSHPELIHDLHAHLERVDCVVDGCHGQELEVQLPAASFEAQARRELDIYLAVWQVMHPGVEAYRVDRDRAE
jgi:hypothetical protein